MRDYIDLSLFGEEIAFSIEEEWEFPDTRRLYCYSCDCDWEEDMAYGYESKYLESMECISRCEKSRIVIEIDTPLGVQRFNPETDQYEDTY